MSSPALFQSAPRPRGRGDAARTLRSTGPESFNPRPARAGGATVVLAAMGFGLRVSIRAPPARAGRRWKLRDSLKAQKFQSAPRPRGRGDPGASGLITMPGPFQSAPRPRGRGDMPADGSAAKACQRFNPRPARAGGATQATTQQQVGGEVSIRAPPARAGRHNHILYTLDNVFVSIRAPPARAGRHRCE